MTDALAFLCGLLLESGRTWGSVAYDWQLADAQAVLEGTLRWTFLLRARGMSKTTDVAALLLTVLVVEAPKRARAYAIAVDAEQAALLVDAIAGLVDRTPGLAGAVDIGTRVTVKASGATLTVLASDAASSFGIKPWLVAVDELAQWPETPNHRRLWASLLSALPKVPGSRLVVMSTAGSPGHSSHKRWERAVTAEHWHAVCRPGPCPWWSPEEVEALRSELLPAEFAQLVLCEWVVGDENLTTLADVLACITHSEPLEPVQRVPYVMSLDVGTRRDATVVAVGHPEASGGGRRIVIDRLLRWRGTRAAPVSLDDVETAIVGLWDRYGRPPLVFDFHQAALLTERLRARGVHCAEYVFSTAGVNRLARTLHGCLRDRTVGLPDDTELIDELAKVRLRETGPGTVKLDHASGDHDDQAVAVALVCEHLLSRDSGIGSIGSVKALNAYRWDRGASVEQLQRLDRRPAWFDQRIDGENPEEVASLIAGGLL